MRYYSFSNFLSLLPCTDIKIMTEHLDDREIRCRLAIRNRRSLEHQPAWGQLMTSEFVNQARFSHPGFSDHRQYLSVPSRYMLYEFFEYLDFRAAPDQRSQPTGSARLHARTRAGSADDRINFDCL